MSKHTPGPWRVQPYTWQRGNVSVFAPKFGRAPYGACVAHTPCSDGVGGADGALANARLIAAAPELLELLREAADYTRHPDYDWPVEFSRRVDAAIAKATGEQP